jgi:hypothetical protein
MPRTEGGGHNLNPDCVRTRAFTMVSKVRDWFFLSTWSFSRESPMSEIDERPKPEVEPKVKN